MSAAAPISSRRRSRAQWLELVERQRASGLNIAEFARREGLVYQTFVGWCRRVARGNGDDRHPIGSPDAVPAALPGFVELGVADGRAERASDRTPDPAPAPDWLVELDLGGRVRLRVRRAA